MNKIFKEKAEQFFKDIEEMSQDELYNMFIECGAEGLTKVKDKKNAGLFCTDNEELKNDSFEIKITNKNKTFLNFNKINIDNKLIKIEEFKTA